MIYSDLHTHSNFCDGNNTPEEMVISAITKGLKTIGIVVHSYVEFDEKYCVKKSGEKEFISVMKELKGKYRDKIQVLCGVEQDAFSNTSTEGFDYVIGSSHYFNVGDKYLNVDHSPERFISVVKEYFNGDYYNACESYFSNLINSPFMKDADIIGHFDLISKFNEGDKLFSSKHPRYVDAYESALNHLLKYKKPFELNTGAISRGYKKFPYPAKNQIDKILSAGGKLVLSSDAHRVENLAFMFEDFEYLLR